MKFEPLTQEVLDRGGLLQKGIRKATIINAEDTISKSSGKEMIKLTVEVFDDNCRQRLFTDYLAAVFKIKNFCDSTDLEENYSSGYLPASICKGKKCLVDIGIEVGGVNPTGGKYPDKNKIVKYIKDTNLVDEDVPF